MPETKIRNFINVIICLKRIILLIEIVRNVIEEFSNFNRVFWKNLKLQFLFVPQRIKLGCEVFHFQKIFEEEFNIDKFWNFIIKIALNFGLNNTFRDTWDPILEDTFDKNYQEFDLIGDILKDLVFGIFEEQISDPKYGK